MLKVKIFVVLAIAIADLVFVPSLLRIPEYIEINPVETMKKWASSVDLVESWFLMLDSETTLRLFMYVQAPILLFTLSLFLMGPIKIKNEKLKGLGGPEATGKGQFGTARFSTNKEMQSSNGTWIMTNGTRPNSGGVVLGMDSKTQRAYYVHDASHTLLLGSTRSGKSRKSLMPSIYLTGKAGESMVITDPKGELFNLTSGYLKSEGYKVIKIDLRDPGKKSNTWNPMQTVVEALNDPELSKQDQLALATERARDLAYMIVFQKERKGDPIWANGELSVTTALIMYIAIEETNPAKQNLISVFRLLRDFGQPIVDPDTSEEYIPLNNLMMELNHEHPARDAFTVAALAPSRQRGSFFSGAASNLLLFSDPNIALMTEENDHRLEDIGTVKSVVFLVIPDETTSRHLLASLYIDQLYSKLVKEANYFGGRLPVQVNFFLDEFGNMPQISKFDTKITVAAGRGMRFTLALQDLNQLKTTYGDAAKTITGNCLVWIFLRTTDIDTAKAISEKTGKYTISTNSVSNNYKNLEASGTTSTSLTSRSLLLPDEIERWPSGMTLILRSGQFPSKLTAPDISEWSAMNEFNKHKPVLIERRNAEKLLQVIEVVEKKLESKTESVKKEKSALEQIRELEGGNELDEFQEEQAK